MSEERDVFGLTEAERKKLLAETQTIGLAIRGELARRGRNAEHGFVCALCDVVKRALGVPPLNVEVDFATAMLAAAKGYEITRKFKGFYVENWYQVDGKGELLNGAYRILPKPKPEPKWISAEEAAVAFVCKRQAVRRRESDGSLSVCWMRWNDYCPRYFSNDGYDDVLRCAWGEFALVHCKFCIVDPATGVPV